MPIIYVHGVATRRDSPDYRTQLAELCTLLRRSVAPVIASDPERVAILPVYWGDLGVQFAYGGRSRPRTPLRGMGADTERPAEACAGRFADLPADELAALLLGASAALPNLTSETRATLQEAVRELIGAAEHVAALRRSTSAAEDRAILATLLGDRYERVRARQRGGLTPMGAAGLAQALLTRAAAMLSPTCATRGLPAVPSELLRPQSDWMLPFLGDVFCYLDRRSAPTEPHRPGAIPALLIAQLDEACTIQRMRGGEPIVVLSHSMGGQIVYDTLTWYLPALDPAAEIRVDFWAAAASQVGLFEEMKLLRASDTAYCAASGRLVPPPDPARLGYWWNSWDHHDPLSFTVRGIFETRPEYPEGVDDEPFAADRLPSASTHSGPLSELAFFRRFAEKLAQVLERRSVCR